MHFVPTFAVGPLTGMSNLRLAPIPSDGKPVSACFRRRYFAIRRSTPQEEAAAWKFVKWMTRPGVSLPAKWDVFPARKSIVNRPDFKEQAKNGIQDMHVLLDANAHAVEPGGLVFGRQKAFRVVWYGLAQCIYGDTPFDAVASDLEKQANDIVKQVEKDADPYALYR